MEHTSNRAIVPTSVTIVRFEHRSHYYHDVTRQVLLYFLLLLLSQSPFFKISLTPLFNTMDPSFYNLKWESLHVPQTLKGESFKRHSHRTIILIMCIVTNGARIDTLNT